MVMDEALLTSVAAALGIGLLIGLERERRKSSGGARAPGGVRTFATASLLGAIAQILGGGIVVAAALLSVGAIAVMSYGRTKDTDPGITTEIALVLTVMLGSLAVPQPALAVGLSVIVTILLVARADLHRFARDILTESEIRDGLILCTAALVVWPLLPDRTIDPFGALNLKKIWTLVVLIMVLGSLGHVGMRVFGTRLGLSFVGFLSGFVSSTATIAAMGERSKTNPDLLLPAVAAATLSTVATFVLLAAVLAVISLPSLQSVLPALIAGGIASLIYGLFFIRRALRDEAVDTRTIGRPFDPMAALVIAGLISLVMLLTSVLNTYYGTSGATLGATMAGFGDAQSAAAAVANLVMSGQLSGDGAVLPIVAGISSNTISKIFVAVACGSRAFAIRIVPGLIFVVASTWLGALF